MGVFVGVGLGGTVAVGVRVRVGVTVGVRVVKMPLIHAPYTVEITSDDHHHAMALGKGWQLVAYYWRRSFLALLSFQLNRRNCFL